VKLLLDGALTHRQDRIPPVRALITMRFIRVSVCSENRLFSDALVDILRSDQSLAVVPLDLADPDSIDVVVVNAGWSDSLAHFWPRLSGSSLPVIVVGAPDDSDDWAVEALEAGARGILTHSASREDLLKAIAIVHGGGIWARRRWLNAYVQKDAVRLLEASGIRHIPAGARLSAREKEVFRHAASGAANKELAERLAISEATVKVHLTRIFQKLGVNGRAELAAVYHGLRTAPGESPRPNTHLKAS
jgi:DNA-binding NarL/FixJ family response regulator